MNRKGKCAEGIGLQNVYREYGGLLDIRAARIVFVANTGSLRMFALHKTRQFISRTKDDS